MQEEESLRRKSVVENKPNRKGNGGNNEDIMKKLSIWMLRVIPMIITAIYLLHTLLSLMNIDCAPLRYIGGISILPLFYIYISSFAFKFCIYHRLFIYYIFMYNMIKIVNYYISIPYSDKIMIWFNLGITGLFLFMLLYIRFKVCKH